MIEEEEGEEEEEDVQWDLSPALSARWPNGKVFDFGSANLPVSIFNLLSFLSPHDMQIGPFVISQTNWLGQQHWSTTTARSENLKSGCDPPKID